MKLIQYTRESILLLLYLCIGHNSSAQIRWHNDSVTTEDIAWNNYSTTYIGAGFDTAPLIVTAIPYNGIYQIDNKELDMSFTGSDFKYQSNLSNRSQLLTTYDSGYVYFLTPGIFTGNVSKYEYRVLKDNREIIKPWSIITKFTDDSFQLNSFRKRCGFLGGYKTTWNHFLTVEIRKESNGNVVASSSVYWQPIRPVLLDIFTLQNLIDAIKKIQSPFDLSLSNEERKTWKEQYAASEINSATGLPQKLILKPEESNVIFYLRATIYKKDALEYSLIKNEKTIINWKPNDYDNNFIWLQKLEHGNYILKMRYSKQRHNVTTYPFEIKAYWYQTKAFYFLFVCLIGLMIVLITYFFINTRRLKERKKENRKTAA